MAPLNDLIHLFPIALEDRLDIAVPVVFDPAIYAEPESCRLGMMAKEYSLNPSFNNDTCPRLFHVSLSHMSSKLFGEACKNKNLFTPLFFPAVGGEARVD